MFYEKVLLLCDKKGISISKLLKDINLSSCLLTKWKNGANPRIETYLKIADYFGVSVDYLRGRETNERKEENNSVQAPSGYEELNEKEKEIINNLISIFLSNKNEMR